jgi:hypothetical protein
MARATRHQAGTVRRHGHGGCAGHADTVEGGEQHRDRGKTGDDALAGRHDDGMLRRSGADGQAKRHCRRHDPLRNAAWELRSDDVDCCALHSRCAVIEANTDWHASCAMAGVRRAFLIAFNLGFLATMVAGCASAPPNRAAWLADNGGLVGGPAQARAEAALARLAPAIEHRIPVRVYVLGSDAVGAFSWPDATLFVHRRLIDGLSDQELSAALAHELGHLLNHGRLQGVASLRGCNHSLDEEARADARGVEVLQASGLDPSAMASMLSKLRDLLPNAPYCRSAIARRMSLLGRTDP